jgi:hypothetical protein
LNPAFQKSDFLLVFHSIKVFLQNFVTPQEEVSGQILSFFGRKCKKVVESGGKWYKIIYVCLGEKDNHYNV